MAADRRPTSSADDPGDEPARGGGDAPGEERFGPLTVRRMAKADGRALLVYAAAPDELETG